MLSRWSFMHEEKLMVRTYGLTHIALAIRDAERALRFYQDVFGVIAVYR
jgi:predicted enzyme related to lactoylglutathione lyase